MANSAPKVLSADYETHDYLLPAYRLATVRSRLETLSRRAVKLGLPAFNITVGDLQYHRSPDGQALQQYYPLTVTGGVPKIDGWRFAAKLDHNIVPKE